MIVNERVVSYINSLQKENNQILEDIHEYAVSTDVPIIRKEMESFLRTMLCLKKPKQVLEIGAGIGYSALLMSYYLPDDAHITTIENYDKRIPLVHDNIKKADMGNKVSLIEGDAAAILPTLSEKYDFIFMDAAKGQYITYLPHFRRLLKSSGMLICDNVLQEGELAESRYAVVRRNRTIHTRMRDFLYELTNDEAFETTIIPIGDGITVSVKKA